MRFQMKLMLSFSAIMILMSIVFFIFFQDIYEKNVMKGVQDREISFCRHTCSQITDMVRKKDVLQLSPALYP